MNNQKIIFPTKTKIAAQLMRITGFLFFLPILIIMMFGFRSGFYSTSYFISSIIFILISLCLFLLFPTFLLKKKRWAWWGSVGILSFFTLSIFYSFISHAIKYGFLSGGISRGIIIPMLLCISVLTLFFVDKKHYWKISSAVEIHISTKRKILIGILIGVILFSGWWVWNNQKKSEPPHFPTLPSIEDLKLCKNDSDCCCCDFLCMDQHPLTLAWGEVHTHICINKNYLGFDIECHPNLRAKNPFCNKHNCKCANGQCISILKPSFTEGKIIEDIEEIENITDWKIYSNEEYGFEMKIPHIIEKGDYEIIKARDKSLPEQNIFKKECTVFLLQKREQSDLVLVIQICPQEYCETQRGKEICESMRKKGEAMFEGNYLFADYLGENKKWIAYFEAGPSIGDVCDAMGLDWREIQQMLSTFRFLE